MRALSRIYVDFKSSIIMLFRGGGSLFWVLAFPVILMLILGAIYSGGVKYELTIQDKDNSNTSAALVSVLNSTDELNVKMIGSSEDADAYIKANQIGAMLIIPTDFGKQVQSNVAARTTPSTAVTQGNFTTTGQTNTSELNVVNTNQASNASKNNTNVTPASLTLKIDQSQLTAPGTTGVVNSVVKSFFTQQAQSKQIGNITNQETLPPQFEYIDFFVPSIISLSVITIGVLGTVGTNTEYRHKGILKKLATTPLKKSEWLVAKILYQCVVIFVSAGLIFVVAKLVYGVHTVPDAVTLLLLFAGAICFTGIGMIVGRFVKNEDAANAASMAIIFPMVFLTGTFIPFELMPNYLQTIAKALPLTYLTDGLRDAMIVGDTAGALSNAFWVLLTGVIFFVIGAVITDWREK